MNASVSQPSRAAHALVPLMHLPDCMAVVRLEPATGADARREVRADLAHRASWSVHFVV
jgi:hypothetical protein